MLCAGFPLQWLLLLWSMGSRHLGFSRCDSQALPSGFWSCGKRAWFLLDMWDLLGPGSNLYALHWQVDSLPLAHHRNPRTFFLLWLNIPCVTASLVNIFFSHSFGIRCLGSSQILTTVNSATMNKSTGISSRYRCHFLWIYIYKIELLDHTFHF